MSISYPSYPQPGDLEDGDDLTLLRRGGDVQKAATTTTALTPTVLVYICIAAVANILFGFENSAISLAKSDFAVEYNINKTGAESSRSSWRHNIAETSPGNAGSSTERNRAAGRDGMREAPQNETGRPAEMEMPNAQVCHKKSESKSN